MRAAAIVLLVLIILPCYGEDNPAATQPGQLESPPLGKVAYIGAQQCVDCHQEQFKLWQGSHHDLAMQPANEQTMLGDFKNTSFDYFGTVSRFSKKDNQYFVQTDGPDGKLTDYPIAYTFGVYPLQQYIIQLSRGRYQVLSIAWDTRDKVEGGQRWFHLYPDEHIEHDDELHWTGINQNWNFMCADCHSTNLQKNYDLASKEYDTTWSEIDVSCEACHGPASRHMKWVENKNDDLKSKGFSVAFNERENISWFIDPDTGNARRNRAKQTNVEIETCAQCHARRLTITPGARPEHALLDNFQVALLDEPLYHADGQINGEVYVYGSFVQSKMYHAGVTCSDCHEPHSLKLRTQGNALCAQCHSSSKYNTAAHHLHKPDSEAGQCVNCHMPAKNYMVVDPRRDHSFRIPRPDLSVKLGTPNACSQCHADKSAHWAANKLEQQHGEPDIKHYAQALHAGRQGLPDAEQRLSELIADDSQPAIARATAVTLLPPYLSRKSAPVLQMAANDEQPLLGLGLALALDSIHQRRRLPFAYPLLYDDMRTTRSLAARALSGSSLQKLPAEAREKYNQALAEFKSSQMFNADRPESLVNLAGLYAQQGQTKQAEQFYQNAITLAPYYTPAYINLADHYRGLGDDTAGEAVLRKAMGQVRDNTAVQHALGLLLVRQKKISEAIDYFRSAAQSPSATDQYVFVYAIALNSTGNAKQALEVLRKAQREYPSNPEILNALVSINNEQGNRKEARHYEKILRTLSW